MGSHVQHMHILFVVCLGFTNIFTFFLRVLLREPWASSIFSFFSFLFFAFLLRVNVTEMHYK